MPIRAAVLRLPPPIWMFLYLAIAGGVSSLFAWRSLVDLRSSEVGAILFFAGFGLSAWAFSLFRAERTEINPTSASNAKLVVRGPFHWTRNPMYLGLVLLSLGVALWVGSLPMFFVPLLVFATANFVHIPFEEEKMRRQFGEAFDAYTQRTRRWI